MITPGMGGKAKKKYAEDLMKQGDMRSYNQIKADIELKLSSWTNNKTIWWTWNFIFRRFILKI